MHLKDVSKINEKIKRDIEYFSIIVVISNL